MCSIPGRHTNSIFLVVDLSLLRGETRDANLAKMTSVISRTWMYVVADQSNNPRGDVTFGFSVYDSHVGGYILSYQLNMVAQGMGIPKNVATTSASNLNGDDLINFLTLITLVTDKNVVDELNLRSSRSSRSSDIPAVETCKVLHTVLKSSFMQRIQKASSGSLTSSENSFYGYLLIFTPSLGAKDVIHAYVGKDALEEMGSIEQAFMKHLPISLWKNIASHRLSCAWISGNSEQDYGTVLSVIQQAVRSVFPSFYLNSLDAISAASMTREQFAVLFDLKLQEEEASSSPRAETQSLMDAFWKCGSMHGSIEFLQTSMAQMMSSTVHVTPLKSKSLKIQRLKHHSSKKAKGSKASAQKPMVGRGKRAMKNARDAANKTSGNDKPDSRGAYQQTNSTVNQNAFQNDNRDEFIAKDISPMSMEEAVEYAKGKIIDLKKQIIAHVEEIGRNDVSIATKALEILQSIVSKSIRSIEMFYHRRQSEYDIKEVKSSLMEDVPLAIRDLQQMHKTTTFEKNYTVSWEATIELILRLSIASYSTEKEDELSEGMQISEYAAIEDAMHIIVASMSPIPSQGHQIFLKVIKPAYISTLEYDIKQLEKSMWDEEEMAVDGDGSLADYHIAAASLEESGETPDESEDNARDRKINSIGKGDKSVSLVPVHAKVAICKEPSASCSQGPACSAEGSGVHGSTIGTTSLSGARSKLSQSNLISRRFNNSKQYGMQVKANSRKPKSLAGSFKKEQNQKVQITRQIPDTPQGKKVEEDIQNKEDGEEKKQYHCLTPDTAIIKKAKDIIPNTTPRDDSGKPNRISRIGSIRQQLFDDTNSKSAFQTLGEKDLLNGEKNKSTWLSGALVRRKRGTNSFASRMGELNGMNSTELPTDALERKDSETNKEIMSPLKLARGCRSLSNISDALQDPSDHVNDNEAHEGAEKSYDPVETDQHTCDIRIVLSPDTKSQHDLTAEAKDGSIHGASGDCSHGRKSSEPEDTEQHTCDIRVVLSPETNLNQNKDDIDAPVEQGEYLSESLFDINRSDDDDSMAAKNECSTSGDSSSQMCNDDGVTSPSCGNKENIIQHRDTPQKNPLLHFDGQTTPLAKSNVDNKRNVARKNPKRGRLAKMLAGPTDQHLKTSPPSAYVSCRSRSPGNKSITVEDRGSPCKASPGSGSFVSLMKQSSSGASPDYSSDTDSCIGDTPDVVIAMKPLIGEPQYNDSDEEDAAILNAAANGSLSPGDEVSKPKPVIRRKRRRSLLAATKGLVDLDVRKKVKQSSKPKQSTKTPKQSTQEERNKPIKNKQLHLTDPKATLKNGNPSKRKMCKMPVEGEEIFCSVTLEGVEQRTRCIIMTVGEAQLRGNNGWICHVEVLPAHVNTSQTGYIKVKLDSSKESPEGSANGPTTWCRVEPESPPNPKIMPKLPCETVVHNMAVKLGTSLIREDSATMLKRSEGDQYGAVVLSSPRRKLQPCNLRYEGEALASAERIQTTPPESLIKSRFGDAKGVELFPETFTVSPCGEVSPEARAAAGNMLGSLYPHLIPVVSSEVVKILTSPLGHK